MPEGNSFGEGQYYNPLDIGFNFGVSYLIGRTMISLKIVRGLQTRNLILKEAERMIEVN